MAPLRPAANEYRLTTIDVERREYGRRYTWLPVDAIDQGSFTIDCTDGYMRPQMYDLRVGDIVRWSHNSQKVQGTIVSLERTQTHIVATLSDVAPLPPDFFGG
ncbi:MAG: hypothetical protein HC876_11600 [Chloroflexaceae bacterium]|nr:hypothetical protein [Chloroflexaceae bacterium]NJO06107.1 hypothetical protein [Chloroflexaceae bacterium]